MCGKRAYFCLASLTFQRQGKLAEVKTSGEYKIASTWGGGAGSGTRALELVRTYGGCGSLPALSAYSLPCSSLEHSKGLLLVMRRSRCVKVCAFTCALFLFQLPSGKHMHEVICLFPFFFFFFSWLLGLNALVIL